MYLINLKLEFGDDATIDEKGTFVNRAYLPQSPITFNDQANDGFSSSETNYLIASVDNKTNRNISNIFRFCQKCEARC